MTFALRIVEPLEAWPVGFEVDQPAGVFVLSQARMDRLRAVLGYVELLDTELAAEPSDPGCRSPKAWLVPAFKLASRDGWLVTPAECALLEEGIQRVVLKEYDELDGMFWDLQILEEEEQEELLDLLRDWATFHAVASARGGYTVGGEG